MFLVVKFATNMVQLTDQKLKNTALPSLQFNSKYNKKKKGSNPFNYFPSLCTNRRKLLYDRNTPFRKIPKALFGGFLCNSDFLLWNPLQISRWTRTWKTVGLLITQKWPWIWGVGIVPLRDNPEILLSRKIDSSLKRKRKPGLVGIVFCKI